jgi:lipoic acid synthetase
MNQPGPKPKWLRRRIPAAGRSRTVQHAIDAGALHTVCAEAHCPNQMECFGRGTATFLLLGPNCTRRCTFCAVHKHPTAPVNPREPEETAKAIRSLGLDFSVLTMVTRDDLADGGAAHVAETIAQVRRHCPDVGVEVLISDLGGDPDALRVVIDAGPEVLNHNVETIPRLYPEVRPQADYRRSVELLARAAAGGRVVTKSGLMLGLGETEAEVLEVLDDLAAAGTRLVTLGHYLAPSSRHHPVVEWVPPEAFERFHQAALDRGFAAAASAPYVRSSYQAGRLYREALDRG